MAVRRLAEEQPVGFAFTPENEAWANAQLEKFPEGRQASAVIPLLWRAQGQHDGWLPEPAIRHVAERLDMPYIRVLEIATFYTMFNLEPVGEHFVQLCGTTPCMLRGAEDIKKVCEKVIGPQRKVTADGKLSWLEVECLGACCNAPMVQINKDYYEDLTPESFAALLDDLRNGRSVKPGPQNGRTGSEPEGGLTTLVGEPPYHTRPASAPVAKVDDKPAAKAETPSVPKAPAAPKEMESSAPKAPAPKNAAEEKTGDKASGTDKAALLESADRPASLSGPLGGHADDLKRISGVGPKIEGILNGLGIYHFGQIAQWNDDNKAWVDGYLSFKGRIDREQWIEQARTLDEGLETPFSKRVDAGDVPSSKS
ncbi:MAG: NADH-quinone oxidoreductase subunit NuoE [Pseudomonadota bacterium]